MESYPKLSSIENGFKKYYAKLETQQKIQKAAKKHGRKIGDTGLFPNIDDKAHKPIAKITEQIKPGPPSNLIIKESFSDIEKALSSASNILSEARIEV